MTENKRFNIKPSSIVDDVTLIIDDEKKYSFPILDNELNYMSCKALNELHEENERLKIDCSILVQSNQEYRKENEQLKADNNRLVNETAKVVAEHQRKVLDLIDKSLEKDKQYYKMNYEDYLNGRIEALEELKKELVE